MHAVLSVQGMPPSEVADLLVTAVRENKLYLLTDHEWDTRWSPGTRRSWPGRSGPPRTGMLDAEGVR